MSFKNQRGITLTALAVSIIIMIILASVTVRTSFTAYENTRTEKFKAEMKVIQEYLYNSVVPNYETWKKETNDTYEKYATENAYYQSLLDEMSPSDPNYRTIYWNYS